MGLTARIQEHYRDQHRDVPADVAIQNAWALFNTGDEGDLYRELMTLGDRTDMADAQREQVQTLWASWAERRAAQASAAGHQRRALQILTAAAQSFPGNPAVSKALAAGYLQVDWAKDALNIYLSLDSTNPTDSDYQSMIGAAISARNIKQAEAWLSVALERFPKDPKILNAAAQFEQARGDTARAAEYWKASLAATSAIPEATELAHILDQPDAVKPGKAPLATDLAGLLRPEDEEAQEVSGVPLPGYHNSLPTGMIAKNEPYGPDPMYAGTAPVQLDSNATLHLPRGLPGGQRAS